jgi:hypothetical protein
MMAIEIPETLIDEIAERVKQKLAIALPPPEQPDEAALEMRRKLALINAKEKITVAEAAKLISCSEGHIRNLVRHAKKRHHKYPIPYCDLQGVTVFNRVALLDWAEGRSREPRAD